MPCQDCQPNIYVDQRLLEQARNLDITEKSGPNSGCNCNPTSSTGFRRNCSCCSCTSCCKCCVGCSNLSGFCSGTSIQENTTAVCENCTVKKEVKAKKVCANCGNDKYA